MLDIQTPSPFNPENFGSVKTELPKKSETQLPESLPGEPKETETLQYYLNKFTLFRHRYIDDLPDHILKLDDPNYNYYKCRTAWWTNISGNAQLLLRENIINDSALSNEFQKFLDYIKTVQNHRQEQRAQGIKHRYTREEINGANAFLDKFIVYLSERSIKSGATTYPPATA